MKLFLTAILVGLLSLSASSAFADGCEKGLSPIGLDLPFHAHSNTLEFSRELKVHSDWTRKFVKDLIRDYRYVGGELYWREKKMRGRYASYVNPEQFHSRSVLLGRIGESLRGFLAKNEVFYLTKEIAESIEIAIADYGYLERHEIQAETPAQAQ